MSVPPEDHLRCRRNNGNVWRCKEMVAPGDKFYCEKHRNYFRSSSKAYVKRKNEKLAKENKQESSQRPRVHVTSAGGDNIVRLEFDAVKQSPLATRIAKCTAPLPSSSSLGPTVENTAQIADMPTERIIEGKAEDMEKDLHASTPALPSLILSVKGRKRKPNKAWDDFIAEDQKYEKYLKNYGRMITSHVNVNSERLSSGTKQDGSQKPRVDGASTSHIEMMGALYEVATSCALTTHDVESAGRPEIDGGSTRYDDMMAVQYDVPSPSSLTIRDMKHVEKSRAVEVNTSHRKMAGVGYDAPLPSPLATHDMKSAEQFEADGKKSSYGNMVEAQYEVSSSSALRVHGVMLGGMSSGNGAGTSYRNIVRTQSDVSSSPGLSGAHGTNTRFGNTIEAHYDVHSSSTFTTHDVMLAGIPRENLASTSYDNTVGSPSDVPASPALTTHDATLAEIFGTGGISTSYNDMVEVQYEPTSSDLRSHNANLAERSGEDRVNASYNDMVGVQNNVRASSALMTCDVKLAEKSEADGANTCFDNMVEEQYYLPSPSALVTHDVKVAAKPETRGKSTSVFEMVGAQIDVTTSSALTTSGAKLSKAQLDGVNLSQEKVAETQFDNASLTTNDGKIAVSSPSLTTLISTLENMAQVFEAPTENFVEDEEGIAADRDFHESTPPLPVEGRKRKPAKAWKDSALLLDQKNQNQCSNSVKMTMNAKKGKRTVERMEEDPLPKSGVRSRQIGMGSAQLKMATPYASTTAKKASAKKPVVLSSSLLSPKSRIAGVCTSHDDVAKTQFNVATHPALTTTKRPAASSPSLLSLISTLDDFKQFTEVPIKCIGEDNVDDVKMQFHQSTPSFPSLFLSVKGRKRKQTKAWVDEELETSGAKRMQQRSSFEVLSGPHEAAVNCNKKQAAADAAQPKNCSSGVEAHLSMLQSSASMCAVDKSKQQSTKNAHSTGFHVESGRKVKSSKASVSGSNFVEQAVTTSSFEGLVNDYSTRARHGQQKEDVSTEKVRIVS